MGSTWLERPDEEQLASTRQADTTAKPRITPKTGVGRLILIRPDNHPTGRAPVSARYRPGVSPMRPIPASTRQYIAATSRRKWGERKESVGVVNQSLRLRRSEFALKCPSEAAALSGPLPLTPPPPTRKRQGRRPSGSRRRLDTAPARFGALWVRSAGSRNSWTNTNRVVSANFVVAIVLGNAVGLEAFY